jgi:hypothetical protein
VIGPTSWFPPFEVLEVVDLFFFAEPVAVQFLVEAGVMRLLPRDSDGSGHDGAPRAWLETAFWSGVLGGACRKALDSVLGSGFRLCVLGEPRCDGWPTR